MKKMLFILAAFQFLSIAIFAQFQKGNYIVGGSFEANFISPSNSDVHNHHIGFDPRVGYYFMNGFAGGIDLTTALTKTGNDKSSDFGGGPFLRYHILKYLYTEVSYQYINHTAQSYDALKADFSKTSFDENRYAAGVGYIFKISRHLAIEPRLFYDVYTANGNSLSSGPVFSIGFHNYFWKYER